MEPLTVESSIGTHGNIVQLDIRTACIKVADIHDFLTSERIDDAEPVTIVRRDEEHNVGERVGHDVGTQGKRCVEVG